MDSRHAALVRLKEIQVEGRHRTVAQIQTMIADFDLLAADLDRQIRAEEDRTKNHDPAHFAYPTLAKATIRRRDNIIRSAAKLKIQLDAAKKAFSEAVEELGAVALPDEGDRIRDQSQVIGGEQGEQVSDLNHAS